MEQRPFYEVAQTCCMPFSNLLAIATRSMRMERAPASGRSLQTTEVSNCNELRQHASVHPLPGLTQTTNAAGGLPHGPPAMWLRQIVATSCFNVVDLQSCRRVLSFNHDRLWTV